MENYTVKSKNSTPEGIEASTALEAALAYAVQKKLSGAEEIAVKRDGSGLLSKPDIFIADDILTEQERVRRKAEAARKQREECAEADRKQAEEARDRENEEAAKLLQEAEAKQNDWIDFSKEERARIEAALETIALKDLESLTDSEKVIYKTAPEFKGRAAFLKKARKADNPGKLKGKVFITTETVCEGLEIVQRKGIVTAQCAFGVWFLKDFLVGASNVLGGRIETAEKAFADSRDKVLEEIEAEAGKLGANAVIGLSINFKDIAAGGSTMMLVVATGTAVEVAPQR